MKREKGKWEEPKATCGRNKKKRGGRGGGGSLFFWGKSVGRSEKKNIQALYNPENFENYGQQ